MAPFSGAIRDKTRHARTLACPKRYKTRHARTLACPNRDKTRPAHTLACPKRYKTRHAPQKSPILAHFRHAGRKLSRSSQKQTKQGEFSLVVSTNNRSRRLVLHRHRRVPVTELVLLMATICSDHGKLTLALTRRSFPPCHVTIRILRKKYRPCSGLHLPA